MLTTSEKANMKKIFAYSLTAILLGAGIILFPLKMFYASHGEEGPIAVVGGSLYVQSLDESESYRALCSPDVYGYPESFTPPLDVEKVTAQPTDPFVGILALSFFVALVVYLLVRRRRPYPSYRYYPFLPRP
mgnify:FL=1